MNSLAGGAITSTGGVGISATTDRVAGVGGDVLPITICVGSATNSDTSVDVFGAANVSVAITIGSGASSVGATGSISITSGDTAGDFETLMRLEETQLFKEKVDYMDYNEMQKLYTYIYKHIWNMKPSRKQLLIYSTNTRIFHEHMFYYRNTTISRHLDEFSSDLLPIRRSGEGIPYIVTFPGPSKDIKMDTEK